MTMMKVMMVCATLAFTGGAYAQSGPVATQCTDDIEKYCSDLEHGSGAVRACLETHISEVSQDCRTALDTTGAGKAAMNVGDIIAKLDGTGYNNIGKIERESGLYEVKATDKNGNRVELYVDAFTGAIISSEIDD